MADGSLLLEAGTDGGGPWIQHLPHQRTGIAAFSWVQVRFFMKAHSDQIFDPAVILSLQTYRSVNMRFTITATRGGGDAGMPQGVQLSEFLLWRAGTQSCFGDSASNRCPKTSTSGKPVQPAASNVSCTAGVGPSYQGVVKCKAKASCIVQHRGSLEDRRLVAGPRNAVDGNLRTKWWVSSEPNVTLVRDLASQTRMC